MRAIGDKAHLMVDREHLEQITAGDRSLLRELVDLYAAHACIEWPILAGTAREGSRDEVRRLAHALKGSSLSLGAMATAKLLEYVEDRALLDDRETMEEAVEAARGAYERACGYLRRMARAAPEER